MTDRKQMDSNADPYVQSISNAGQNAASKVCSHSWAADLLRTDLLCSSVLQVEWTAAHEESSSTYLPNVHAQQDDAHSLFGKDVVKSCGKNNSSI